MPLLDGIRARREEILKLAEECGLTDIRVFGSVARGEEGAESDIDMLASIRPGKSLMALAKFKAEVEDRLHKPIDVRRPDRCIGIYVTAC